MFEKMLENRFVRLTLSIVSLIVLAIIMGIFDTSVATFTVLLVHLIAIVHQVCMDILNVRKFNGTAYEKIRKTISYAVSGLFVLLSLIFSFDPKDATFGLVLFGNAAFPSCVLIMCMCIISDREDADRKWLPLIPVASYAGGLLIGLLRRSPPLRRSPRLPSAAVIKTMTMTVTMITMTDGSRNCRSRTKRNSTARSGIR